MRVLGVAFFSDWRLVKTELITARDMAQIACSERVVAECARLRFVGSGGLGTLRVVNKSAGLAIEERG